MATSVVEICNSALIKCGARRIFSLDDATKEARLCKSQYPIARDFCLRLHPWNCAIKRVTLAPLAQTPKYEYTYQFQLPDDCLRPLIDHDECDDWRIEGRTILTNQSSLNLKYVSQVVDPVLFDTNLTEVIAAYLAADIVFSLTGSETQRTTLLQIFNIINPLAKSVDAKEEPTIEVQADLFLKSRTSGPGRPLRRDRDA
jgi:hypothetical protein